MEAKYIEPIELKSVRLVKSEDLNHHGTLFAGRTAEWFVESGFIAVGTQLNPKNVVCLQIHGMRFLKPVKAGSIVTFTSKIVLAGKSSLVAHISVSTNNDVMPLVHGFVTFIYVNEETIPSPHHLIITPKTDEDKVLYEEALLLKKK
jgi:acyl-CoA hydrolase